MEKLHYYSLMINSFLMNTKETEEFFVCNTVPTTNYNTVLLFVYASFLFFFAIIENCCHWKYLRQIIALKRFVINFYKYIKNRYLHLSTYIWVLFWMNICNWSIVMYFFEVSKDWIKQRTLGLLEQKTQTSLCFIQIILCSNDVGLFHSKII